MLTVGQIQNLNRQMIAGGVPKEEDYVGYSKPDYARMFELSRLILPDENETYAILETLQHYKNTQLVSYKEELEDTFREYREKMPSFAEQFSYDRGMFTHLTSHKKEDFASTVLTLTEVAHYTVSVKFGEYIEDDRLTQFIRKDHKGKWKDGSIQIKWEDVPEFLEFAPDLGKYGYDCSTLRNIYLTLKENPIEMTEEERNAENIRENREGYIPVELKVSNCYSGNFCIQISSKEPHTKDYLRNIIWNMQKNQTFSIDDLKYDGNTISFTIPYKQYSDLSDYIGTVAHLEDYWKKRDGCNGFLISKQLIPNPENFYNNYEKLRNASSDRLLDVSKLTLSFSPYPFQIEDAKNLVSHKRMLLGNDMGTGKSFVASLVGASIKGKKLVIVPEPLRLNWVREIKNVEPDADVHILYSKDEFALGQDWTIVGYKTAEKYATELANSDFSCVFADEAHYVKAVNNYGKPTSKRGQAVTAICEKPEHVYLMTGTPIPTRNKDLYNLLRILRVPEVENGTFFDFGVKYCDGFDNGFGWDFSGSSNAEELHEMLSDIMIRRLKKEVLPDLIKQRQFIPLDIHSYKVTRIEKQLGAAEDQDTFLGLCQTGRRYLSEAKVSDCIDFANNLLDQGESVVIVTEFNDTVAALEETYKDNCCKIVGGLSDKEKQQAVDDFQSGKKKVCILNTIAGGVGITLTKAHNMIIMDYDWTPANMSQVEDRICRAGQTEGCNIFYLYANGSVLDETFVQMISDKSRNIDHVVDNTENTMDLHGTKGEHSISTLQALQIATGFQKKKEKTLTPLQKSSLKRTKKNPKPNNMER